MNELIEGNGTGDGAVIYVHGGGFAHTAPEAERALARRLSRVTGRPVLRVDYRLAPAHPYPAALEDVLAAWRSVLARGVPAERVAFFGESAGGTLVLSALLEIERTGGPRPGAAVVVSPVTDLALTGASLTANDGEDVIDRAVLTSVCAQYLAGADPQGAPQSPLYGDLRGLPPLLVAVGGDEVLLDDARRFARAAEAAGVSVRLRVHEDMKHAFHLSEEDGAALFEEAGQLLADLADLGDGAGTSTSTSTTGTGTGAGPVREFSVGDPDAGPYALAEGPDGALWFTLVHRGAVARRDPGDGSVTVHPVGAGPTVIAPGPDGAMWFTEYQAHRIGRIAPDGSYSSFAPLTAEGGPFGITAGPDGAMWFTLSAADRVGRVTMDGVVTEFPAPGAFPSAITVGPDGALWCTLNQQNAVGRLTTDGHGTVHPLPTGGAAPVGIAAGPDGALWFAEIGAGRIGRITVDGEITEYPLPDPAARPHAVTAGPDGALWFTEWGSGRVGRITVDGRVTSYALSRPDSEPHGITQHGGALWCALETGSLARIEVPA